MSTRGIKVNRARILSKQTLKMAVLFLVLIKKKFETRLNFARAYLIWLSIDK